ncbi:uncharacterized protein LOC100166829 [Acyrthosiphon pisum]|uniref:Peptidase S1 domain-containing protein n=1 Tax=Acyrthosiphon pisum TaxID=7029 RepID=A0A8R1W355_ACYPI|nr:uncharacterized protein LOC100166829 [Acyrthosiphon pisum]|eukprot:XP_001951627.2 PREDICTED: uncharacterized protein LOC100166829 [Acyrthosiphon pisum]
MAHNTRPVIVMLFLIAIICIVTSLPASMNMPLVDPGLFVISGVKTCGNTFGYCLLGSDCTMDDDFLPDATGNCDGLKRAFTPSAPFACCKFNQRSPQSGTPMIESKGTKKAANTVPKDKLGRNTRENIDSSQMDSDQLAKLNEIELVVKKIVEQLINETANNIKAEETILNTETKMEENTIRYSINDEKPTINDIIEIKDTTVDPLTNPEETLDEGYGKKEIPLEIKKDNETITPDTTESESEEPSIDDEFKAEKRICQKSCKSEIIFLVDKKPMCYGTLLDDIWILTSATCASRLNKSGIRKVTVSRKDLVGPTLSISNILVHENFKSPVSKSAPENNDLALASLTVPLEGQACTPCFSQKNTVTNEVCKTSQNPNFKNTVKSSENCEGRVQLRKLISNPYIILPCNHWRMQYNQEGRLGSSLWCDGKLAGVQTGVGVGSLIYTPVNEYAMWISDNKRIEERR